VLERLARDAGVRLRLKLYEHVEAFQADLATGVADFAYANPVQAIRAFQAARYRPLVRDEEPVQGVFFVERGSPIASVADLAGREVAFVGPWSVCSITLRRDARGLGVVPRYVGTSANAYKNVILGLVAAGGTLDSVLRAAPSGVRDQLRIIYATEPMAPHPVVAHPRVPAGGAARLADAVRALAETEGGRELLRQVNMPQPVLAEYGRDYAPLQRILDDAEAPGRAARRP
jgi:phosphonate transport system substrate-binding protein